MDPQTNLYLQYYQAQTGGRLSAFEGARRVQVGNGLGDILRGIFRHVLPIAARGASTFLSQTLSGRDGGLGWKEAAKSAIMPTAHNVVTQSLDKIGNAVQSQSGNGRTRLRARRRKRTQKGYVSPSVGGQTDQTGGRRRRRHKQGTRSGYKRKRSGSKGHTKARQSIKKIKFLNF